MIQFRKLRKCYEESFSIKVIQVSSFSLPILNTVSQNHWWSSLHFHDNRQNFIIIWFLELYIKTTNLYTIYSRVKSSKKENLTRK